MFSALYYRFWNVWWRCCWEYWKYFMMNKRMRAFIALLLPVEDYGLSVCVSMWVSIFYARNFDVMGYLNELLPLILCVFVCCVWVMHASFVYITFSQPRVTVSFVVRVKNYAKTNSSLFVYVCQSNFNLAMIILTEIFKQILNESESKRKIKGKKRKNQTTSTNITYVVWHSEMDNI